MNAWRTETKTTRGERGRPRSRWRSSGRPASAGSAARAAVAACAPAAAGRRRRIGGQPRLAVTTGRVRRPRFYGNRIPGGGASSRRRSPGAYAASCRPAAAAFSLPGGTRQPAALGPYAYDPPNRIGHRADHRRHRRRHGPGRHRGDRAHQGVSGRRHRARRPHRRLRARRHRADRRQRRRKVDPDQDPPRPARAHAGHGEGARPRLRQPAASRSAGWSATCPSTTACRPTSRRPSSSPTWAGCRACRPPPPRSGPPRRCATSACTRSATGQIGTYSTGMKQRVKLAQALVGDPRLLLLDEPTNGLDPAGRNAMLELIARIGDRVRHLHRGRLAPARRDRADLRPPRRDRGRQAAAGRHDRQLHPGQPDPASSRSRRARARCATELARRGAARPALPAGPARARRRRAAPTTRSATASRPSACR